MLCPQKQQNRSSQSVVVVVADADAGLPSSASQARFLGDIGESSVAIVFVEMRSRSLSCGPLLAETRSVCQINVEPAVVIVIEKCDAAALCFNDVSLVIGIAPNVRVIQARFSCATSTNCTGDSGRYAAEATEARVGYSISRAEL